MWVLRCDVNINILLNLSPVTTSETVQGHMDYCGPTAESSGLCTVRKSEVKQYIPLPYSKHKQ